MAKEYSRTQRVADQMQRELALLIQREVRDPRVGMITVTGAEVSRDLAHAKVYVTALQAGRSEEALKGLRGLAGEIRFRLARRVKLRHVPELHFHYDDSMDRGERIDALLRDGAPDAGEQAP